MDLQKFDSTLKSALENLEVPFDASTWAALESRLDTLSAPDAVDKAVRPALDRMETPYDTGSWAVLANRMDSLVRVRRLRMTKACEAAIFLLLLLNLKGFFGVVESVTKPAPVQKEIQGPIAKNRPSKAKKQVAVNALTDATQTADESLAQQVVSFVQNLAASFSTDAETSPLEAPVASSRSVLDPANFYSQSGIVEFPIGSSLPSLPTEPVLYASSQITIPGIEIPKVVKPSRFYGATFASYDKNYLNEAQHTDKKDGYGGGIAVGYRKGKWGVETGLSYSQKNYKPNRVNEEYYNDPFIGIGYVYVDQVDADVFSVPVKVTRRIAKVGKTTAHAIAGVTTHFASSKSYALKTVHYLPPVIDPSPNPNPNPPSISGFPEGKGVLENGGLTHNAYATADLGLRVEQPIGKRYIAFVEPMYRHSMGGGLGPRASRLHTFSLQAGVMASL